MCAPNRVDYLEIPLDYDNYQAGYYSPEQALASACLTRAISDSVGWVYSPGSGTTPAEKAEIVLEAREWISSERETEYSFLHICDILHLDAELVRGQLIELRNASPYDLQQLSERLSGYRSDSVGRSRFRRKRRSRK